MRPRDADIAGTPTREARGHAVGAGAPH
jgi:hypothetical protein